MSYGERTEQLTRIYEEALKMHGLLEHIEGFVLTRLFVELCTKLYDDWHWMRQGA